MNHPQRSWYEVAGWTGLVLVVAGLGLLAASKLFDNIFFGFAAFFVFAAGTLLLMGTLQVLWFKNLFRLLAAAGKKMQRYMATPRRGR